VLGSETDGVVICVKGGKTPREQVARVRDKLARAGVRILGVVLNDLSEESLRSSRQYGYYDAYYGAAPEGQAGTGESTGEPGAKPTRSAGTA
jgi:Mrp family chromosome partitioning ATPase